MLNKCITNAPKLFLTSRLTNEIRKFSSKLVTNANLTELTIGGSFEVLFSLNVNHVSVSPTNGIGSTQGQRENSH